MDCSPENLAAPMARTIVTNLQDRSECPEQSNRHGEPLRHDLAARCHLVAESPGYDAEDRQRHRDEPRMNVKYFAQQQRHLEKLTLPLKKPRQEKIEHGYGNLGESSGF
jgi:hypothetical protein